MSSAAAPRSPATQSTRQLLDELDALMQRMLSLPVNQFDEPPQPPAPPPAPAAPAVSVVTISQAPPLDALAPGGRRPPAPAEFRPAPMPEALRPAPEVIAGRVIVPHAPEPPAPSHREEEHEPPAPPPVRSLPLTEPPPVRVEAPARPASPLQAWAPKPITPTTLPPGALATADPAARPPEPATDPAPGPADDELVEAEPVPPRPGLLLRPLLWWNRAFDRFTVVLGPLGRCLRSRAGRHLLGWVGLGLWSAALVLAAVRRFG
jgi:hypothetical protein